ncbi:MAG: AAA family ATPase [Novosphingobium sp.]
MRLRSSSAALHRFGDSPLSPECTPLPAVLERLGLSVGQDRSPAERPGSLTRDGAADVSVISLDDARALRGLSAPASRAGQPGTPFAAQLRALLTTLSVSRGNEAARTIAFASVAGSAGANTVSASLATMAALSGLRVALIDANLGDPRLHAIYGLPNEPGLANLLLEEASARGVLQSCSVPNLAVIAAGSAGHGHASLLLRERVLHRIEPVMAAFDFVIIDCATLPAGLVASAARGATDVIVGARRHGSSLNALREMLDALGADGIDNASVLILE